MGAFLGEDHYRVHTSQRGEDCRPLLFRDKRPPGPFQFAHRMVPVEADDKYIAEFPGALEITHMAKVQQIETPIGRDDPLAAPAHRSRPDCGLLQG